MSAARSYASWHVDDPSAHTRSRPRQSPRTLDSADPSGTGIDSSSGGETSPGADTSATPDLGGLSVVGITRRRVGWASATFVAIWIVVVFARQVGDAQAATNHASQLAHDNAALAAEVDGLQRELDLIVKPDYVAQEARAHRFGSPREISFSLDPSVPAPVDGAPGSASVRLGATTDRETPLESWLSLLFGPTS
jgi:hypothetical protein